MNKIVILGASGYVGLSLMRTLIELESTSVTVLCRSPQTFNGKFPFSEKVIIFQGDILDANSLEGLFEKDCVVINLAYLRGSNESENLMAINNLVDACKSAGIKRFIHLSTAMVSGRTNSIEITEEEMGDPRTEYATTKLSVEKAIANAATGYFDFVILRPTAIFGPNSENLKKLGNDLIEGKRVRNYLKSCLFNRRRMNLVHISNVIGAIVFMQNRKENLNGEIFIVSDSEATRNNFRDVESGLMAELGISDYSFPRLKIPVFVLRWLLIFLGKDNANPRSDYLSTKLRDLGYRKPQKFEDALVDYATWLRSNNKYS